MTTLLSTLRPLLPKLVDDLRERSESEPEIAEFLRTEHATAKKAGRTGESRADFGEELLDQAAVAWILAVVFVRFLEDHGLVDEGDGRGSRVVRRYLGGHDLPHLELARETQREYFQREPRHGEREYLLWVFERIAEMPGMEALLGKRHDPLWRITLSADAARDLLETFRRRDPATGEILHPFDATGTRFLGDLYQDLSEHAKKRYALLQTPDFVESFLLDRTLEPAIEEFGYREVRMIDPACGSGHFLLGAFARLLEHGRRHEPGTEGRALVQRVLAQVHGVDLNPFAAAIARFRLLIAALEACGIDRLGAAPDFRMRVATGDALLHGRRPGRVTQETQIRLDDQGEHYFATEDGELLREVLGQTYHAVVANPPYITVKDKGQREMIRGRFGSCYGKYSLVCPFLERLFDLAISPPKGESTPAGHVGAIVANSFLKRQFGKPLVEDYIPRWDLTHVIDTSGAYIPGHGTPTVILIARSRKPVASTVRAALGIRGEPATPDDPADGEVWSAMVRQIDQAGSESDFISVADVERERFGHHPWSLQGGGAAALKTTLEAAGELKLRARAHEVGVVAVTGEDDVFVGARRKWERRRVPHEALREFVVGEGIRDWKDIPFVALFPMGVENEAAIQAISRSCWSFRTLLQSGIYFGRNKEDRGIRWFDYAFRAESKLRTPLSIAFAFVATHNHFVLDRGGKVFNRSAPVIKLHADASEDDHLALLGILNSSVACFWMKQVFFCKGSTVDSRGARQTTVPFEDFWEHDGTKLQQFPLAADPPLDLARRLDDLASEREEHSPAAVLVEWKKDDATDELAKRLADARTDDEAVRRLMIATQEELDWRCYSLYGVLDEDLTYGDEPPEVALGQRAFEIALARKVAAGEAETEWFNRHRSTPITEIPERWPAPYRDLIERRLERIAAQKEIELLERPEYKRRWASDPWEKRQQAALEEWLLDRLEEPDLWQGEPALISTARLADSLRHDARFREVASIYRGRPDVELEPLVRELVTGQGAPFLAAQRYKPSGLRKRSRWEETWELQRAEDRIDARAELPPGHADHLSRDDADRLKRREVGDIPVPPKYTSADFRASSIWRLRGKLDVPKERFVLYPGAEREADPTPVLTWAGFDHLQQARALATWYIDARQNEGWPPERLIPLLAGIVELLPWLHQWHDEPDPDIGMGMGEYFAAFVEEEARAMGVSVEELERWER